MPDEFEQYIDWSKVDLLDACYDPAIGRMGPDRCVFFLLLANKKGVRILYVSLGHQSNGLRNTESSQLWPSPKSNFEEIWTPPNAIKNFSNELVTIPDDGGLSGNILPKVSPGTMSNPGRQSFEESLANTITRPVSPCRQCGESFGKIHKFWRDACKVTHARESNHGSYGCKVANCDTTFTHYKERDAHERTPHISGHGRISTTTLNDCVECEETFTSKATLLRHAKEAQHQPYGCECGALFSRLDVLNRHLESFSDEHPKHPCKYCKRHRGPNGFRRLDHLQQHIRHYHHLEMDEKLGEASSRLKYTFPVCSHLGCPQYRDEAFKQLPRKSQAENKPFNSQSAYTKHMRDEHNECTFPCDIPGCTRIGRRGYFREKDLLNHRRQEHPDAPKYVVPKRELRIRCTEPGCGSLLDITSMTSHAREHRWRLRQDERMRNQEAESLRARTEQQGAEGSWPRASQNPTSLPTQSSDFFVSPKGLHQQQ